MFVVETAGLEAAVELTEAFVGRTSLCLLVPVTCGAARVEVVSRSGRSPGRRHGPDLTEVDPAAGSSNGIPPPPMWIRRQARRSSERRRTSGNPRHPPDDRPTHRNTKHAATAAHYPH